MKEEAKGIKSEEFLRSVLRTNLENNIDTSENLYRTIGYLSPSNWIALTYEAIDILESFALYYPLLITERMIVKILEKAEENDELAISVIFNMLGNFYRWGVNFSDVIKNKITNMAQYGVFDVGREARTLLNVINR